MDPFVGEVRIWPGQFSPVNWVFCDGRLLPINTYQLLYTIIGTTYGGDGVSAFAIPDLRDKVPIHYGQGPSLTPRPLGSTAGEATVGLNLGNLPSHNHPWMVTTTQATNNMPASNMVLAAGDPSLNIGWFEEVGHSQATANLSNTCIPDSGGSGENHDNLMPMMSLNFIIATNGIFPTRN